MESIIKKPVAVAVFDVCDTMYYSNTTHDFIEFVLDREPMSSKKAAHLLVNSKISPLRYFLIGFGIVTGKDIFKKINVSFLRGESVDNLFVAAQQFVNEKLSGRKVDAIHQLLHKYTAEGIGIVLCSSSIEPVVKAVALATDIRDYVSTTLEHIDGKFTGRIDQEVSGRKLEALAAWNPNAKIKFAVSDNLSDLELLSSAGHAIGVVHNLRNRKFWKDHGFEIIDLSL